MARTEDENRLVKNVEGLVKRLREKADELTATPPTMANLGLLPHVLERLAAIDEARANRMDLFAKIVQVNTKLAETRLIALAAVQNLLVEAKNTLASLEVSGIQQCASLLRWFDALMTLTASNLRVSEGFRALSPQFNELQALFVKKAIAILQDVFARASTNDPKTPWPALLRDLGDFDDLLSISPALFADAQGIQSLLDRVKTVFCPPPADASTRQAVQPVHVNQVVWDLYNNPAAPYLATTASSAFGGVCSNIFRLALPATNERIWVNSPLPKTPNKRAIALNWISTRLHEQACVLRAQCQVDLRPQESADGYFKSITLHSFSDDQYFQEKESVIHFVHLPRQKTYHLTKYREHVVHLPFATVVQWRKNRLYANEAKSPPRQKLGNMSLSYVGSSYGVKANGPTNQYILTREFDGDAEYSLIAVSITADEDKVKCPNLVGYKREWTNWVIITKLDDSSTSVVQMSVATGLQFSNFDFVPYDNVVREEDCAGPSATFDAMTRHLKTYYAEAFGKDAARCIKGLKDQATNQPVVAEPTVVAETEEYNVDQLADDVAYLANPDEVDMESVLDNLPAPPSVAPAKVAMAAEAQAAPLYGQNAKREREYFADDETKRSRLEIEREDALKRALTSLSARRASLFGSSGKGFVQLVKILRSSPMDVITYLCLENDEASLREWIEDLLSDNVMTSRFRSS